MKSGGVKIALDAKVDKEDGKGIVTLGNGDGVAGKAEQLSDGGEGIYFFVGPNKWFIGGSQQSFVATEAMLPYAKSSTVGTRQVLTITATTAPSPVTLPAIPATDEVLNCDIVVNGTAAEQDFGLEIETEVLPDGSQDKIKFPNGEAIVCKAGCITMVTCVGINSLGWLVVGCNNFCDPTETV